MENFNRANSIDNLIFEKFYRNGRTPLAEAVLHDHHEVIQFLRNCGAHFVGCLKYIGEELCR